MHHEWENIQMKNRINRTAKEKCFHLRLRKCLILHQMIKHHGFWLLMQKVLTGSIAECVLICTRAVCEKGGLHHNTSESSSTGKCWRRMDGSVFVWPLIAVFNSVFSHLSLCGCCSCCSSLVKHNLTDFCHGSNCSPDAQIFYMNIDTTQTQTNRGKIKFKETASNI